METLLAVNDLTVSFEGFTAVNKVSFTIEKGSTTAIVGESGSGKSLTGLSLLSLLPKAAKISGKAIFNSEKASLNLFEISDSETKNLRGRKISMIFQEPMTSLNPIMKCGDQVAEAIMTHRKLSRKEAKLETIEWFSKTELPDPVEVYDKYPHQLSGGQKQRVMIAMAMCCEPELIIADEPTTALDVTVQKSILELLNKLKSENGCTVILITHDLGLVWDYAENLIVMSKGSIVEQGKVKQVINSPSHKYTENLLKNRPSSLIPLSQNQIIRGKSILEVHELNVMYKRKSGRINKVFHAIRNVNFSVKKGELVGLVGESGCGKSTLGKAILGLVPSTGSILLNGRDISGFKKSDNKYFRKEMQIVFQDPFGSLNPRIPVDNAISEVIKVQSPQTKKAERLGKVKALFREVSIDPINMGRYPHEFSGGQRQRICIARSLASEPSFLVFDESVSALDVTIQAQVLALIDKLRKELEFSGIFISHDLAVVKYLCDRIVVMRNGEIIEEGPSSDIYYNPKHSYTKELLEAVPGKGMDTTG